MTIFVQWVLVKTLQHHDTVDFLHDSETEDPQLVAEPGVGRNHGRERDDEDSSGTTVWTGSISKFLSANTGEHIPTMETGSSTLAGDLIVEEELAGRMTFETAQK